MIYCVELKRRMFKRPWENKINGLTRNVLKL
jgi:hypothetical protein